MDQAVIRRRRNGGFNPSRLFNASEPGQLSEVNPAYLFQDTAGTTPVTATGQSVALWMDRSGRGNNDTQATVGSRPIYGKHPANGYRNMLASSEDFSAAYWLTQGGSWSAVDANGFQTFTEDSALSQHRLYKDALVVTSGRSYTVSARVAYGTRRWAFLSFYDGVATSTAWFDLQNGAKGSVTASATSTMTTVSSGVYDITLTRVAAGSTSAGNAQIGTQTADSQTANWTANGSTMRVAKYQLEESATATTYQRTGASSGVAWPAPPSYDITEAGQQDLHYLHYNGVSSFMVSPTITPATDKAQVFLGVRKFSDSPQGHIVGGNGNTSGEFEILSGGWSIAANRYGAAFCTGVLAQIDSQPNFAPPRTDVLSWRLDTSGATAPDKAKLNVNAVAQTLSIAGSPSSGNFSAFVNYTGRRGGTSIPFNGLVYSKIVRFGANLTADQIASTERWTAQRTGVSL